MSKNNTADRWMHRDSITGDWKSGRINMPIRQQMERQDIQ
jgi:hypothetical protein